ncbi:hypothetical protein QO058_04430 [Bosea vestrisii]|uniref:hypothetical protein n=1 Tax=Bosea vestrisii TaxID=151416 RepID=UPI0024DFEF0E|nr:hypothetical protein [Bosea vestrisii]WID97520.1 hypothetical protein QO058_04430 [Bosea vestrisii]
MTLVLLWKNGSDAVVIADTLFRSGERNALEVGPKIFSIPVRIEAYGEHEEPARHCLDMGFAFAGHTAAGQVTHAIASAGLRNLTGPLGSSAPSVAAVSDYYARCAVQVVGEIRKYYPSDKCLFEGVVFGWENEGAVAHSFEIGVDAEGGATSKSEPMDFKRFGLYGLGQGVAEVQDFIDRSWAAGRKASPYEALQAIIEDERVPGVGGSIQAATVSVRGVELKPVLRIDNGGLAKGGYMGIDQDRLGAVGDLLPLGTRPVGLVKVPAPDRSRLGD